MSSIWRIFHNIRIVEEIKNKDDMSPESHMAKFLGIGTVHL